MTGLEGDGPKLQCHQQGKGRVPTAPHRAAPQCTAPHGTALHHTTPQDYSMQNGAKTALCRGDRDREAG